MQAAILLPRHKLTVDHYHKMAETGILTVLDRVELIEGELIDMAPIGSTGLWPFLKNQWLTEQVYKLVNPIESITYSE